MRSGEKGRWGEMARYFGDEANCKIASLNLKSSPQRGDPAHAGLVAPGKDPESFLSGECHPGYAMQQQNKAQLQMIAETKTIYAPQIKGRTELTQNL